MTAASHRTLLITILAIACVTVAPLKLANAETTDIDDSVTWNREHLGDKYAIYSKISSGVITPYIYGDHLSFVDGIAAADINGKWGVVDTTGATVVSFKHDYLFYFYHQGEKSCEPGRTKACLNGKWGYIDIHEQPVIPLVYDELHESGYNDHWRYALAKLNGKWGVIAHDGREPVPFEYDEMGFGNADNKNDGVLVWVKQGAEQFMIAVDPAGKRYYYSEIGAIYAGDTWARDAATGKVGFIRPDGSQLAAPAYDKAHEFHDGMAMIWLNGRYGFVNAGGQLAIPPTYRVALAPNGGATQQMPLDYVPPPLPEGIEQSSIGPHAYMDMVVRHDWERMYGENGAKADCVGDFACGLALVRLNGLYGYIDKQNNIVITPRYEQAAMFKEFEYKKLFQEPRSMRAAAVMLNGKWALIDLDGNLLTRFKFKYPNTLTAAFSQPPL